MKEAGRNALWIPAFAGMTIYGAFAATVIPAKAGIQSAREFFNGLLTTLATLTQIFTRIHIKGPVLEGIRTEPSCEEKPAHASVHTNQRAGQLHNQSLFLVPTVLRGNAYSPSR